MAVSCSVRTGYEHLNYPSQYNQTPSVTTHHRAVANGTTTPLPLVLRRDKRMGMVLRQTGPAPERGLRPARALQHATNPASGPVGLPPRRGRLANESDALDAFDTQLAAQRDLRLAEMDEAWLEVKGLLAGEEEERREVLQRLFPLPTQTQMPTTPPLDGATIHDCLRRPDHHHRYLPTCLPRSCVLPRHPHSRR